MFLYCYKTRQEREQIGVLPFKVGKFRPSLFSGFFVDGESWNWMVFLVRLSFYFQTAGQGMIFFVRDDDGKLMHTSYAIPKCFKFPFMQRGDWEIGPCYTYEQFRGQGIYPNVLRYIVMNLSKNENTFYVVVNKENNSSIKGIEKAGFVQVGCVAKTKFLKRYCLEKETY